MICRSTEIYNVFEISCNSFSHCILNKQLNYYLVYVKIDILLEELSTQCTFYTHWKITWSRSFWAVMDDVGKKHETVAQITKSAYEALPTVKSLQPSSSSSSSSSSKSLLATKYVYNVLRILLYKNLGRKNL